ncbi:MAG: tRNA (adenosine(37)-N6)-dimethylallyltransferase MiaA [Acidimicrobiales bacterium]
MTGSNPGHAPGRAGSPPVVALVGPTASGKSELALRVAEASRAPGRAYTADGLPPVELVSVDSMAVYRGMDIGTAKPSRQVRVRIPYHLVDLVDPWEEFTVQRFQGLARRALGDIASRAHGALLVGGTGLYLRSVIDDLTFPGRYPEVAGALAAEVDTAGPPGSDAERSALAELHRRLSLLDPIASRRIEPANRRRLLRALEVTMGSGHRFSSFGPGLERYPTSAVRLVGLRRDPTTLDQRITERFGLLMEQGFLQEVRALAGRPEGVSRTARQALGYRELLAHVEGGVPLAEAVAEAVRRTRAFSRRQWAWFRRDPRIVWLDPDDAPERAILALLGGIPRQGATVGD